MSGPPLIMHYIVISCHRNTIGANEKITGNYFGMQLTCMLVQNGLSQWCLLLNTLENEIQHWGNGSSKIAHFGRKCTFSLNCTEVWSTNLSSHARFPRCNVRDNSGVATAQRRAHWIQESFTFFMSSMGSEFLKQGMTFLKQGLMFQKQGLTY